MKAFKFEKKKNRYYYTKSFTINLVDNTPRFGKAGNPVEISVPEFLKDFKFNSVASLVAEMKMLGKLVGRIGCAKICRYRDRLFALSSENMSTQTSNSLFLIDLSGKRARKEFIDCWESEYYMLDGMEDTK